MEELCAALPDNNPIIMDQSENSSEISDTDHEQVFSLSSEASEGTNGKKTMRLLGFVGQQQILTLVDSGSSANFISSALVELLHCETVAAPLVQVTIANGTKMASDKQITAFRWGCQNIKFHTPVRVLDLPCYDLILGMEWLTEFSPMWVDWKIKKLRINVNGKRVTLRGIKDNTTHCPTISVKQFQDMMQHGAVAQLVQLSLTNDVSQHETVPESVQQVLLEHVTVFQEPTQLPPHRMFDHKIPLIPGAQPVHRKPYRYTPS